jgi:hypothetical protein
MDKFVRAVDRWAVFKAEDELKSGCGLEGNFSGETEARFSIADVEVAADARADGGDNS